MEWTDSFKNRIILKIVNEIIKNYVEYNCGGEWSSDYESFNLDTSSATVAVYTVTLPSALSGTITGLRFTDGGVNNPHATIVYAQRDENIIKRSDQALIIKFKIYVKDGE